MVFSLIVLFAVMGLIQTGMYKIFGALFGTIVLIGMCLSVYIVFLALLFTGGHF